MEKKKLEKQLSDLKEKLKGHLKNEMDHENLFKEFSKFLDKPSKNK